MSLHPLDATSIAVAATALTALGLMAAPPPVAALICVTVVFVATSLAQILSRMQRSAA